MAVVVTVIVLIVVYLFLVLPRLWQKLDRASFVKVHYAHRGLFNNEGEKPENSLAAFKAAVAAGYGIELDVQLSKDGVPVVFHDASLQRMCGVDGRVWEYTLAELKGMRLAGSGETIPTFAEALNVIDGRVPIIVEYKLDRVQTKICELADGLLCRYQGVYCIECFHPLALIWYRKHRPEVVRGQLSMDFVRDKAYNGFKYGMLAYLLTNIATRPDFIAYRHTDAGNLSRRVCRRLGAMSAAWTIKSQAEYEAVKDKFDIFIFDSFLLK